MEKHCDPSRGADKEEAGRQTPLRDRQTDRYPSETDRNPSETDRQTSSRRAAQVSFELLY